MLLQAAYWSTDISPNTQSIGRSIRTPSILTPSGIVSKNGSISLNPKVAVPGIQSAPAAPASARNGFAFRDEDEVCAIDDEHRVDVGDVHCGAGRLALVVEGREEIQHRNAHHLSDGIKILDGRRAKNWHYCAHHRPSHE